VSTQTLDPAVVRTPRRLRAGRRLVAAGQGLVGFVVLIGLWELLRATGVFPQAEVPPAGQVARALVDGVRDHTLLTTTGHTLQAWALGLALAAAIGLPVGALIGLSGWADALTSDVIDFFRPIPSVAYVPVALVFLGFGLKMEVVLIVVGAVWPLVFNTRYGVRDVDPMLVQVGRSLHLSRTAVLLRIRLVAALPAILTGLRTASSIALILAVSAETLAVPEGLGNIIAQASVTGDFAAAYAAILITGVLGVVMNVLIGYLRARTTRWSLSRLEQE
jgi:ABC-type nitrate/sulfonate/bicarbonate transport system permease component